MENVLRHYKYIHIFWHDDLKFSTRIVQMINDQSNGFTVADHLFVTPYLRVYNALKDFGFSDLLALDGGGSWYHKYNGKTPFMLTDRDVNNLVIFG